MRNIEATVVVSHRETWIEIKYIEFQEREASSSLTERRGLKSSNTLVHLSYQWSSLTERRGLKFHMLFCFLHQGKVVSHRETWIEIS